MATHNELDRRTSLKLSALAVLGLAIPNVVFSHNNPTLFIPKAKSSVPEHFPNIPPEVISEVVGKSHFDLDAVKAIVDKRPELARSVWEWRFGDFESAIGAASHVGRRDIVQYLIDKGARPTLFTFAMLGHYEVVKAAVGASPGIQQTMGPHGISLLDHALTGKRMQDSMTQSENDNLERTIAYLTSLGDAAGADYINVPPEEQQKYLGNYKYGTGETDGFTIALNMRKLLSLGPIGGFGGALYKLEDNLFTYNGVPSVQITFGIQDGIVQSLTLTDPDLQVTAQKVS